MVSFAVMLEPSICTPVVPDDGAATESDGVHGLACTFVVVIDGLQRVVRFSFEASPVNVAYHQYVFPAAMVAAPFE